MKKLLIVLSLLLLCACSNDTEINNEPVKKEYIEPVNDVEVFKYLNKETYDLLYKANGGKEVDAYILEYLGKDLVDSELVDYYGNTINLSDYKNSKLIIEVSASWCTHCMEQSSKYNDELLKAYPDIKLIQYFNDGDKEHVEAFYKEIGRDVPNDIPVIPSDSEFSNLLLSTYNPQFYPGFLFFNNGKMTWLKISELTKEEMDLAYDVAFNDGLDLKKLVDENGKSIFTYRRSVNDVKNDLAKENLKRLEYLDNDHYTVNETLKYIGSVFDFRNQLENDSAFVAEADLLAYENQNLVIFYLYEANEKAVSLINDYYDAHGEDIKVVVVNTTDEKCEEMARLLNPPLISIMNQIPKVLNDIQFVSYPSCVFVEKGTITGTYSNIVDIESLNEATDMFIGDNCIALKSNN